MWRERERKGERRRERERMRVTKRRGRVGREIEGVLTRNTTTWTKKLEKFFTTTSRLVYKSIMVLIGSHTWSVQSGQLEVWTPATTSDHSLLPDNSRMRLAKTVLCVTSKYGLNFRDIRCTFKYRLNFCVRDIRSTFRSSFLEIAHSYSSPYTTHKV